jgi:hypothetical protein
MKKPRSKVLRTVRDLSADPQNANRGTPRGRAMLETSMRRYGFGRSIVADRHGVVIAGNKTIEAAGAIGENPNVIVVQSTGKDLVVVQRTDLDLATDVKAKELAVADNRVSEEGLAWDVTVLGNLARQGLDTQQFWRAAEWEALLKDAGSSLQTAEEVPGMPLQPFEEYNYLLVVFKNSQDWQGACDRLGIKRESVVLGGARKIGLGRVVDGAAMLEELCGPASSSRAGSASRRSRPTRSRSSPTRSSASAKAKRKPTAA